MQTAFATLFADAAAQSRVAFRMGINIGDIWVDAEDIYGAGVNVAARLESLAHAGGICISGSVYDAVKHKIAARYEAMGPQRVKNVSEPIHAWRIAGVEAGSLAVRSRRTASRRHWLQGGAAVAITVAVGAVVARNWDGNPSRALDVRRAHCA